MSFYIFVFLFFFFFFFNDTATTEIYTLSLHDALPISSAQIHQQPAENPQLTASRPGEPRPSDKSQVGYETGAMPASSRTRSESCLLVGSMIRASTSCLNASSWSVACANPSVS